MDLSCINPTISYFVVEEMLTKTEKYQIHYVLFFSRNTRDYLWTQNGKLSCAKVTRFSYGPLSSAARQHQRRLLLLSAHNSKSLKHLLTKTDWGGHCTDSFQREIDGLQFNKGKFGHNSSLPWSCYHYLKVIQVIKYEYSKYNKKNNVEFNFGNAKVSSSIWIVLQFESLLWGISHGC